jgi:hypothetical protein
LTVVVLAGGRDVFLIESGYLWRKRVNHLSSHCFVVVEAAYSLVTLRAHPEPRIKGEGRLQRVKAGDKELM